MTFEDAVRAYFGVDDTWRVYSEMGDMSGTGCDTCGYGGDDPISIGVSGGAPGKYEHHEKSFDSLPELWAALVKEA